MTKPLYIYSSSNFCHRVEGALPNLKGAILEACGKSIRRIDRLTQLALIGCFACKGSRSVQANTGLYLSSANGSINNMIKVLDEIYTEAEVPRPLSFVNTVSNSAGYYLARELDVLACNQFISGQEFTFESSLKLAQIDLECGKVCAALIGAISEVGADLEIHRNRMALDQQFSLCEGSHWLYLAEHLPDENPLAEFVELDVSIPRSRLNEKLRVLSGSDGVVVFGDGIQPGLRTDLAELAGCAAADFGLADARHDNHCALQVTSFLEQTKGDTMIYVDANTCDRFSLVIIKRV